MRKRSEPHTFEQRLAEQKLRLEREASELPEGELREAIARRIEQLQRAADINEWLSQGGKAARKPGVADC
jgi:DNA-binding protein H-NS